MQVQEIALRRRLTLPLLVLYGVGVSIGAGIYVLIGAMASHAGTRAPLAFVLAGVVMGLTAASYAELCTRFPVAAGEASYVNAALRSRMLSTVTGLVTIAIGVVSAAAVSIGSAGYIREFIDAPVPLIVAIVVCALGLIAVWGILESVVLASIFTVIEIGGLVAIIVAGLGADIDVISALPQLLAPPQDVSGWAGIAFASLLAFFAFIGFEDLANVVEEVREPDYAMPRAIGLTLVISVTLYFWVAAIAVLTVPLAELSASPAPLSLVFQQTAGFSPAAISAIAVVATLNTILVQITMATRVIYGMSSRGDLPRFLGQLNRTTATPVLATAAVTLVVLLFAVSLPIEPLAKWTSLATLAVFSLVNVSLIVLHRTDWYRRVHTGFAAPSWVPVAGLITCLCMLASAFF